MARYQLHYLITVQDKSGDRMLMKIPALNEADTLTLANLATNTAALVTALGAPGVITNGKVVGSGVQVLFSLVDPNSAPLPIDAEFPSVADHARLTFASTAGSKTSSAIPAPIEAIFHLPPADSTVDPGSSVSAWLTAFETYATDASNLAYSVYLGGVRSKVRARRRVTHRS